MKTVFLVMVVSAMLVTLGFAQTPNAGSNTDPATVKGCLGGSDGSYTVAENGSRQIFKITTSSVDLKPHVGHDVKLIGHKAAGAVSSGAADNSFAVTELSMISEHCAVAVAAASATLIPPSETVITPVVDAAASATATAPAGDAAAPVSPSSATASAPAAPAVTVSPSSPTVSTPAVDAAAPAVAVGRTSPIVSTPAVDTAAPAVTVGPSAATAITPAVDTAAPAAVSPSPAVVAPPAAEAAHSARPSAHARKLATTQAAAAVAPDTTVSPSPDSGSPAAADAATSTVPASPPSETASAPAAAVPAPVTHRTGSLTLLITFVVLVIVLGTMAPLIGRWRKRKILERNGSPNLSFNNEVNTIEASSDLEKPEPLKVA